MDPLLPVQKYILAYVSGSSSTIEYVEVRPFLGVASAAIWQRVGLLLRDDGSADVRLHSAGVQTFLHGYSGVAAIFGKVVIFCDLRRYW